MREPTIRNQVWSIPIGKLVPHPDSPNRMSKKNYARLVRNIERTGRYEPLVVRPCPRREGFFQIINGHCRCEALAELGHQTADVLIWQLDDHDADILLTTLNRLRGTDALEKRLELVRRLSERTQARDLAKLLPCTGSQIQRLASISTEGLSKIRLTKPDFATPLVYFVNDEQKEVIERAFSLAGDFSGGKTKAQKNAAILTQMAEQFSRTS